MIQIAQPLGIRWTIGDLRERAFELLRLSIASVFRLFGAKARYAVCVNSLSADEARLRTGSLPTEVEWIEVTARDIPMLLHPYLDNQMGEGTSWKFVPLRVFPDRHELALDNDCILWNLPEGMRQWLCSNDRCLIAEDVERRLGIFDHLCPPGCHNSGIRGLPPGDDFEAALIAVLAAYKKGQTQRLHFASELDEQGLQVAAASWRHPALVVRTGEVSICSPFWPRSTRLGSCGAHFVGMNASHLPWNYYGRPADAWMEEHWLRQRPVIYDIAGLAPPEPAGIDRQMDRGGSLYP